MNRLLEVFLAWAALALLAAGNAVGKARSVQLGPDGLLVPPPSISVPPAPAACSLDVVKNISWGAATAAYQIEGAYNQGGKGQSIWDMFVTKPGKIKGGDTGNVAIDHAHRYKGDYQLMKNLGINMHRFSISWPRIVPSGKAGSPISKEGLQFYHSLIDEMLANGITPVATIYHWDLPQALQDSYQGFAAEKSDKFVQDYVYYADTLWSNFGSKVKHWVTFNEPASICDHGYNNGRYAPGVNGGKTVMFRCGHNLLLAHAAAVQLYRTKYQPQQKGKVGLTTNVVWPEPMTDKPEDKRAQQNMLDREFGWIADPVFFGDYPAGSKLALKSDLPTFTPEQQAQLKDSVDFIGLNVYTARWVFANPDNPNGFKVTSKKNGVPIGEVGGAEWLYMTPFALGNLMRYVGERYGRPETWIMEFGTGINGENLLQGEQALQDSYRTKFFSAYLNSACENIKKHNLNVPMVFAWTMWDNFEWAEGFQVRYGLVHVDFKTLERRVKQSGYWWSKHFFRHSKQPSI